MIAFSLAGQEAAAQATVGFIHKHAGTSAGYTLFPPSYAKKTYLIDNCGKLIRSWVSAYTAGHAAYLLPDGSLLRAADLLNQAFPSGGRGGGIERFDWDGNRTWSYIHSDTLECMHHDIQPMPNGNVLAIAWSKKTRAEAVAAGRNPNSTGDEFWTERIIEIEPTGPTSGTIVWEWNVWDHIIQDFDSTKTGYGKVSDHPELVNINTYPFKVSDWLHINSIDYNPELDQVMLCVHSLNEIWVIDHGTMAHEAAGHAGGKRGKGGDLLFRWGNPMTYKRGTIADKVLYGQHDAQWIPAGFPHAGDILIFNNGVMRPQGAYSTVERIRPPLTPDSTYQISYSTAFGPDAPEFIYPAQSNSLFFSQSISGVQALPNGNYLICEGESGEFFEIDSLQIPLWRYVNPVTATGILSQGSTPRMNAVFKIRRYPPSYPAFAGRVLPPGEPIELNPIPYECEVETGIPGIAEPSGSFEFYPHPARTGVDVRWTGGGIRTIRIVDLLGRPALSLPDQISPARVDVSRLITGTYLLHCAGHIRLLSIVR